MSPSQLTAVQPHRAIEGGRITIKGGPFAIDGGGPPEVRIGDVRARVVCASSASLTVLVPAGLSEGGRLTVRIAGFTGETAFLDVAAPCANGLHQVDNPVFDALGNLYVTYSGARGQQVPVSIFRVRPNGTRESFSSSIVNPTSLAIDPEGRLYASSRFEGVVYRVDADGTAQPFARELGVACGLAFDGEGTLLVGDRSGTVFKVDRAGHATPFASLPSSVAAFHLAFGPDRCIYVAGPTLAPYDCVYRIDPEGHVTPSVQRFGRPQGLTFDANGALYVVEALAGDSGLYRISGDGDPELVLAGPGLIGVAFDPRGGVVVCSNDTAYRLTEW